MWVQVPPSAPFLFSLGGGFQSNARFSALCVRFVFGTSHVHATAYPTQNQTHRLPSENNVCRLYDPFQDILGELRLLFHEEEVLMIRTRYPDYKSQQIAHSCFLKRMYLQQTTSGNDFGQDAVQWLTRHETISDALFRIYLEKKTIRTAENIIFDLHAPDHVITSEDGHF
ncbi:MAG: hypothetical protein IKK25_00280 [Lentisphaeria bacterium]|nr:hypothetical protein [Lentisphaeria bacterium]